MQLDKRALILLHAAVDRLGSVAAVARELGYARSSVSMAADGRYPGNARHLQAAIIERYADGLFCPHLRVEIAPAACRDHRERPLPTSPRAAVKHWQACRACPLNPATKPSEDTP